MLDEFPSLRAQRDAFRAAAEREMVVTRPARRRARARRMGLAVLVGILGVGGVAAATELIAVGVPEPDSVPRRAEQLPSRPSEVVTTAPDTPLPWGVAIYTGAGGRACVLVGQVRRSGLGLVRDGVFRPYARDTAGPCAPQGGDAGFIDAVALADRTLFYGRAPAAARQVELAQRDGRKRVATPARGGAFLFVYDRSTSVEDIDAVTYRDAAGRRLP